MPWSNYPPEDNVASLWYGIFDGEQWIHLERIPSTIDGRPLSYSASSLIRHGGAVAWAVKTVKADGTRGVTVFQRSENGTWSSKAVPVTDPLYLDLAYSEGLGFVLVVAEGPTNVNSLSYYTGRSGWSHLRKVFGPSSRRIDHPDLKLKDSTAILTWQSGIADSVGTRFEGVTIVGSFDGIDESMIVADAPITQILPIQSRTGQVVWISSTDSPDGSGDLHITIPSPTGNSILGSTADPFAGLIGATFIDRSTAVLVGPRLERIGGENVLLTLLLSAEVTCAIDRLHE
ncbi:MAG TPA: hypothetical protein VFI91_02800 [Longimicrobiaceae bacterium]|nr:hypothetical protein [Longimicrobiaceae bacterium]